MTEETPSKFTDKELEHMMTQARRDDWHRIFVGSEIRVLIGEIRVLIGMAMELAAVRAELEQMKDMLRNADVEIKAANAELERVKGGGYIPGCGEDLEWSARHAEVIAASRATLQPAKEQEP